jgi:predicted amidophosphoribosyltransferase
MEKYYEKKAIRGGAARPCSKCKAQLSRYNNSMLCSTCEKSINIDNKNKLFRMIDDVS